LEKKTTNLSWLKRAKQLEYHWDTMTLSSSEYLRKMTEYKEWKPAKCNVDTAIASALGPIGLYNVGPQLSVGL